MSQPYDVMNKGGLWKNDNRTKPTQPNYKGGLMCRCQCGVVTDYWLSAWTPDKDRQQSQNAPLLKLAVTPKEHQPQQTEQAQQPQQFQPQQQQPQQGQYQGQQQSPQQSQPPAFEDDFPF